MQNFTYLRLKKKHAGICRGRMLLRRLVVGSLASADWVLPVVARGDRFPV